MKSHFLQFFVLILVMSSVGAARIQDGQDIVDENKELHAQIQLAYNFNSEAFDWFESADFDHQVALNSFVAATAKYWLYQADRIDKTKRLDAERRLSFSIDRAKSALKKDKNNPVLRFLYGVGYCNRARYYVEEQSWFRAYLDSREGLGTLRELIEDHPEYADAKFAVGVAECFLSDAPTLLKPLARLLGFKGSADAGIEKLEYCMEHGEFTSVEACYYLAYYYYNVARDGEKAVELFSSLASRFPENPLYGYFLGRSYQISHQPLEALAAYRVSKEVSYRKGSEDIGNWSSYRIGNILHGEHLCKEALLEYEELKARMNAETHHQEYYFRLPLKFARSLIEIGDIPAAKAYLNVIRRDWDGDTYKMAKKLLKEIE